MQLAVNQEDTEILLTERNQLSEQVLEKYRTAGQITQTTLKYVAQLINDSYHLGKTERPYTIQELCVLGDSMAYKLLGNVYTNTEKVREKGMAHPVSIDVNEYVNNVSPELDANTEQYTFHQGDVVTITAGAQIDGYTALLSHTVVIYPPGVEIDNELKPAGPLMGAKADAIAATYIATEAVVALLGLALTPEKIASVPGLENTTVISGSLIRSIADSIAESFGCVVIPGSKVRRVRRFLAGQAEGIVAERDFKGVVWDESSQEASLLRKSTGTDLVLHDNKQAAFTNNVSSIPTDDFIVLPGEVYNIDLKLCSTTDFEEKGLITLEDVDDMSLKPTVFIRDVAITHHLKLKSARRLLGIVDRQFSVYPFKLTHTCDSFPVNFEAGNVAEQLEQIRKEIKQHKLGLSELANRYLARPKPIQLVKHVPFQKILTTSNPTGRHGVDAAKLTLPGKEIPLPALGISAIKLKSLLKFGSLAPAVARESTTVILNNLNSEVIRLTGGNQALRPSWVHSKYQIAGAYVQSVQALSALVQDSRFGIKVKEVQPFKLNSEVLNLEETMQLD